MSNSFKIHSSKTLIEGKLQDLTLTITNGKITDIQSGNTGADVDTDGKVLMPGLLDPHVHVNEPGRTEWEGFDTATRSAAAGGITTLVDMPLNSSPVTTSVPNFEAKKKALEGKLVMNCAFWGGLVPENSHNLEPLCKSGVWGIKAFTCHSGIDDFPNATEVDIRTAMPVIRDNGQKLLVHAELLSDNPEAHLMENNPTNYMAYLASRPRKWEDDAIAMLIELVEETGCPVHVVHLSSSNSIAQLTAARKKGLPITIETCPQYLYFNAEEIPNGDTRYKCAPPIREKENNEQIWQAVKDGLIDFIATDHSPAPPHIKEMDSGNLAKAWGGISSLQFLLPVVWTKAKERGFTIEDMGALLSTNAAKIYGFEGKGEIAVGKDADLVVWDPEATFTITPDIIQHRHKITPYENEKLHGVVTQTYVDGYKVYDKGEFVYLTAGKAILKEN
jgi:allantoinase